MKKFNVKENMELVISQKFKEEIKSSVFSASNNFNQATSSWDKKFLAKILTFNPLNNEIETFTCYGFNYSEVIDYIKLISSKDEYKNNQLIKIITSEGFTYHGFMSHDEEKINNELNLKYMEIYISIIDSYNDDEITEFDFSIRTENYLLRAGIETVQQLKNMTFSEICKIRNLGMKGIIEIEEKLNIKYDRNLR